MYKYNVQLLYAKTVFREAVKVRKKLKGRSAAVKVRFSYVRYNSIAWDGDAPSGPCMYDGDGMGVSLRGLQPHSGSGAGAPAGVRGGAPRKKNCEFWLHFG